MIPPHPVYLFDIDGTLLDSAADICGAIQQVLSMTECRDTPFEYLRGYIGRALIELFQELFPGQAAERTEAMLQEYRSIYHARGHSHTRLYPGVYESLSKLPGRKATATTKGTPTTRLVLEQFELLPYFNHIQGTDGIPCKPAPDVLFAAMRGLSAQPEECLMVGDSPADMEAGRRAGVKTCAVRYGYGRAEELARWEPDYWISDLRELCPE